MSQSRLIHRDAKAVIDRLREAGHDPYEVSTLHRLWLSAKAATDTNRRLAADNRALRAVLEQTEGTR